MTWQDEVTEVEWGKWVVFALRISKARGISPSLGADDYAATAIEKLLVQIERPKNIEGWLALTISRQYIDRFRRLNGRGGADLRIFDESDWDKEMLSHALGEAIDDFVMRESVDEVLEVLGDKEKEILLLSAAGFDNHRIAAELNYGSGKNVATKLGQIRKKVRDKFDQAGTSRR